MNKYAIENATTLLIMIKWMKKKNLKPINVYLNSPIEETKTFFFWLKNKHDENSLRKQARSQIDIIQHKAFRQKSH